MTEPHYPVTVTELAEAEKESALEEARIRCNNNEHRYAPWTLAWKRCADCGAKARIIPPRVSPAAGRTSATASQATCGSLSRVP